MSDLPRRVPGARLQELVEPPEGGWFTPVGWPTEDDRRKATETVADLMRVVAPYLESVGVPADEQTEEFFTRVLDGVRRLSPD